MAGSGQTGRCRALIVALACVIEASGCAWPQQWTGRPIEAGFWFERVAYDSTRLSGALTAAEIETIAAVARSEVTSAFDGFHINISDQRNTRYRVRVVQELREELSRRGMRVAGESRAASGLGGAGAVSFAFVASGAMVYSPEDASRAVLIEAIGRGIGRVAAHEFAHQLLPKASIHDTADRQSYEYESAARPEQYFGDMRWDVARPLLMARVGLAR